MRRAGRSRAAAHGAARALYMGWNTPVRHQRLPYLTVVLESAEPSTQFRISMDSFSTAAKMSGSVVHGTKHPKFVHQGFSYLAASAPQTGMEKLVPRQVASTCTR